MSTLRQTPCSLSKVSNKISSQCTRRDHYPKSDPRTLHSKRVVAASNPTSRVGMNGIRKSIFSSAHARRNAEMFLRSLTPTQLAKLRAAIIDRLKERRRNLKEQNQSKVRDTSLNSSESTLSRCQSIPVNSKGYTSRPIFATHFRTQQCIKGCQTITLPILFVNLWRSVGLVCKLRVPKR